MGKIKRQDDKHEEVIACFMYALAITPNQQTLIQLTNLYSLQNDFKKIEQLDQKVESYPFERMILFGRIYRKANFLNNAIRCYEKAIEINPKSEVALNELGLIKNCIYLKKKLNNSTKVLQNRIHTIYKYILAC